MKFRMGFNEVWSRYTATPLPVMERNTHLVFRRSFFSTKDAFSSVNTGDLLVFIWPEV